MVRQNKRFYVFLFSFAWLLSVNISLYALPNPPQLLSPENGETTVSTTPLFEWQPLPHAASYDLEILSIDKKVIRDQEIKPGTSAKWKVPSQYLLKGPAIYYWRLRAICGEIESNWTELRSFTVQENSWAPEDDDDKDGIPNNREKEYFHTDPEKVTLFVRPKKEVSFEYKYWKEFLSLFPDPRPGFARIPPFDHAGVEIVVIGPCHTISENDKCHQYKKFDDFYYDPAKDPLHPPCDIMEIVYKMKFNDEQEGIHCADYSSHGGHTFFSEDGNTIVNGDKKDTSTWTWDTKGYTRKGEEHHSYFVPLIFPFPLDNYLKEGAYKSIDVNIVPETTNCNNSGGKCMHNSPMNLNDNDPNPPYTLRPDETVEFNGICFDSNGKITNKPARAKGYDRDTVLKRTIVHEMGHALLSADKEDHCENPMCIMYKGTLDWEMHDFGPCRKKYCCEHGAGGAKDIRKMIYNHPHY